MEHMISLTGLSQGYLITARVRALNTNGWALRSQENIIGALIQVAPHKVETVFYDVANSSNTQIILQWNEPEGVSTGGSETTGYTVQYDQGNGNFIPSAVSGGLTSKTFTSL